MSADTLSSPENGTATHSQKEVLVLAAYGLMQEHPDGFPLEHLTVAAFTRSALQFCLSGFPEHPDHNKVKINVHGKKGLEKGDHVLEKVKPGIYRLTARGRNRARRLLGDTANMEPEEGMEEANTTEGKDDGELEEDDHLTGEERRLLTLLTSGPLAEKMNKSLNEWTFKDACDLWDLKEGTVGDDVDRVIAAATSALQAAQDKAEAGEEGSLPFGKHTLLPGNIRAFSGMSRSLEEKFKKHLNVLRARAKNGRAQPGKKTVQHA